MVIKIVVIFFIFMMILLMMFDTEEKVSFSDITDVWYNSDDFVKELVNDVKEIVNEKQ